MTLFIRFFYYYYYCSNGCLLLDCPEAQTNSICGEPPDPQLLPDYCRSVQLPPASSKYGPFCLQNDSYSGLHSLPSPHERSASCYRKHHPSNKSVLIIIIRLYIKSRVQKSWVHLWNVSVLHLILIETFNNKLYFYYNSTLHVTFYFFLFLEILKLKTQESQTFGPHCMFWKKKCFFI